MNQQNIHYKPAQSVV